MEFLNNSILPLTLPSESKINKPNVHPTLSKNQTVRTLIMQIINKIESKFLQRKDFSVVASFSRRRERARAHN